MLGQTSRVSSSHQNQQKGLYTHVCPEMSGFRV